MRKYEGKRIGKSKVKTTKKGIMERETREAQRMRKKRNVQRKG